MAPNWFAGYVIDETAPWLDALLDTAPQDLRFFTPQDLHITFAFFGSVGEDAARRGWEVLHDARPHPVEISFAALEPFGRPSRPSAFSLTLDQGREEVVAQMKRWRSEALKAADARPDDRDPKPHITIARPSRRASREVVDAGIAWCEEATIPDVRLTLDRLALYTWSDDRNQTLFRIVEDLSLDA